jgi:hypothetical protein
MPSIATPLLRWTVLAFLTLILPFSALQAQKAERYTISGGDVAIYNLAGEVKVEPGSGVVTAEVTRAGADAAKLKVLAGEIDGWQTLRLIYPEDRVQYSRLPDGSSTQLRVRDNGTFGDEREGEGKQRGKRVTIAGRGGIDAYADVRVMVPPGKRVAIYLAVGKVAVTNVEGELTIDAASAPVTSSNTRGDLSIDVGSGEVQVTDSRGELTIDTGSGAVAASDVRGESISIDTGSGDVTVNDIRSSDLSIETGSGDIRVTNLIAPKVALQTGSGAVTADVGGEVWNVDVQTGSGDITLKLPPNLGAEVDIETSSGDIETDYAVSVTRHARDHLTGRIGDGRGKIAIETGSGGIKLFKGQ